jgi:uncharacterized SAM-binding protein YcdF (DUF218 family)
MKPKIIVWIYLALVYVLLNNVLQAIVVIQNGVFTLLSPALSVIIIVVTCVAIIGLVKMMPWSRIVACIVIGIQASGTLVTGMQYFIENSEGISLENILMSSIIIEFLLLFLAFRIYTSKPLKDYLGP